MKQRLRQFLSQRQKHYITDTSRVSAAVLVPIYHKQGLYYLLFTKRSQKVKEHKGQISFPGGVYQEGDRTLVNTALRECTEEIGLMAKDIEVLGELDDIISRTSNYIISPFVAFIPWPYQFRVNTDETEELIEVPLSELDASSLHHETEIINGETVTSYFYCYEDKVTGEW